MYGMCPEAYMALRYVQERAPDDAAIHMGSLTWHILANPAFTDLKAEGKGDVQVAAVHLMARLVASCLLDAFRDR